VEHISEKQKDEVKSVTQPSMAKRRLPRRRFFELAGAGGLGLAVGGTGAYVARSVASGSSVSSSPAQATMPLRFFNESEAQLVSAMAERIFPADSEGPGANDLHVTTYIDGQLAGAWGIGAKLYQQGPFFEPEDSGHGWQSPLTPRDVYRLALQDIEVFCQQQYHLSFVQLDTEKQDRVLHILQAGQVTPFQALPSDQFFQLFRQNVVEGLFSDPLYGGNYQMLGWKWVGFPGDPMAYGDPYKRYIDHFDQPYTVDPRPLQ
jgi:gluconate 2-dehydrogenase gamma chain